MSDTTAQRLDSPSMFYRFRAALFVALMALNVLVVAIPLILLSPLLPLKQRFRFSNLWCHTFVLLSRWILGVTYRVRGLNHMPQQPAIIYSNHQSALETFCLQTLFPPYVWILKRELLKIPFFGWGLAMLKPIAIDRSAGRNAIAQLVAQGRERLAEGMWVLVFPEGTRVAPGGRRRYKLGGAILAKESGAPLVPVAHNAGLLWPPRELLNKRPGVVDIVIGPPIVPKGQSAEALTQSAQGWIESTLTELGT